MLILLNDMNEFKNILCDEYILSDISGLKYINIKQTDIMKDVNIRIVLLLINKTYYSMRIDLVGYNPNIETLFSYGCFKQENNVIILNDVPSGFQMVLEKINESSFLCKKGFYFLINKIFQYKESYSIDEDFPIDRWIVEHEKREDLFKKGRSNNPISFKLGTYGHSLIVEINNRYKLFEDADAELRLLLSEGSWMKEGNKLSLYDSSLDYSFLLLIRNDDLLKIRYPDNALINGIYLFPQKNQMYPFTMW